MGTEQSSTKLIFWYSQQRRCTNKFQNGHRTAYPVAALTICWDGYHPFCHCKMTKAAMSVLDRQGHIDEKLSLRRVIAAIMPFIITGNINATSNDD